MSSTRGVLLAEGNEGQRVSTTDRTFSLTVFTASTDSYGLTTGVGWFVVGALLLLAYQIYLHSQFLGKARLDDSH